MPLYPSLDDDLTLITTGSRPLKRTIQMNINSTNPSTSSLPLFKLKCLCLNNVKELDESTLDDCRFENLSSLSIANIPLLVSLPLSLQHLVQLKTLEIVDCSGLRSLFPVFQHLTSLETLRIRNCKELELSADGIQTFRDYTCLGDLYLESIPKCRNLPRWIQHLTNLRKLHLNNFPNLTSLPDEMRCLTTLQQLMLERIPMLEDGMRFHRVYGEDWQKIAHIPHVFAHGKWMQDRW
ncbi:hypothetical protein HRI_000246200 [Hibiscus trionum]|uniref:Uncharacterized protein n=1 Tax=Hibiscus trionum TaxID=183268 RepID=A0A9W7GUB9_HIBTR|nr:hypothetical protein HRI_000246200 [Hibiscus trionum]